MSILDLQEPPSTRSANGYLRGLAGGEQSSLPRKRQLSYQPADS